MSVFFEVLILWGVVCSFNTFSKEKEIIGIVDKGFDSWMARWDNKNIQSSDTLEDFILRFQKTTNISKKEYFTPMELKKVLDLANAIYKDGKMELLEPYLYNYMYKTNIISLGEFKKYILEQPVLSCPIKQLISDKNFFKKNLPQDPTLSKKIFDLTKNSKDKLFVKTILTNFSKNLSLYPKGDFKSELEETFKTIKIDNSESSEKSFNPVLSSLLHHVQCDKAKNLIESQIKNSGISSESEISPLVKRLALCYERTNRKTAKNTWDFYDKIIKEKFGLISWAQYQVSKSRYFWNKELYQDAKSYLRHVAELKGIKDLDNQRAQAIFYLGQISEDEDDDKTAERFYEFFLEESFEDSIKFEVYRSLTLLYLKQAHWNKVVQLTDDLLFSKDSRLLDSEYSVFFSFSLFWQAMAYSKKKEPLKAQKIWKELAQDYFSTYYGVLGHYMLEQHDKKAHPIYPMNESSFTMEQLFTSFSKESEASIKRAERLLEMGLKEECLCELREIDDNNLNQEKFAKMVISYGAGDWLAAIRILNDLPRTYRKTLPLGIEKILYPRKYEDQIELYAKKMVLDVDMVYALIRQESVFNPKAFSLASARGLMQLMEPTAKIEAKQLSAHYVSLKEKLNIIQKISTPSNLFDVETNVTLGIHYFAKLNKRYDNIVLALSAYNAGPMKADKWMKRFPMDNVLLFIEEIPYKETRNYVKVILRNYFYYKRWYQKPNEKMPHLASLLNQSSVF